MTVVLGVDASRAGWIGVVLSDGGFVAALLGPDLARLSATASLISEVSVIGVGLPIGLPDKGRRDADLLARVLLGPRRSSAVLTPTRAALELDSYAEAGLLSRELGEPVPSRQAYALRGRILELDAWARRSGLAVVEAHPEVSFATLAGGPLAESKKTWAGMTARRRLLADVGITLPDDLGEAGSAAVDDVLDATAVAWTALRVSRGQAVSFPSLPQRFGDGHSAAIWA
jgi:predicted RNase H-like nuclease